MAKSKSGQRCRRWFAGTRRFEVLESRRLLAMDTFAGIGLQAQYYADAMMENLSHVVTDVTVDFDWQGGSPADGNGTPLSSDDFAVRWSGQVEAVATETVTFRVIGEGELRLWIGRKLVADSFGQSGLTDQSIDVDLISGRRYDVVLEYRETSGDASVSLQWAGAQTGVMQPIPVEQWFPAARGSLQRSVWTGVAGDDIGDLQGLSSFPESPDTVTSLERFEIAGDLGNDFGDSVNGFLHPVQTGVYRFYLAADHAAELRLSNTDDLSQAVTIASVTEPTLPRQWDASPTQQSADVYLVAGQSYAIETLRKESDGSDHLSVGWRRMSGDFPDAKPQIIAGEFLSPPRPEVRLYAVRPTTAEGSVEGATFQVVRTGNAVSLPLTVDLMTRGTATPGVDTSVIPTNITIPAGENSAEFSIEATADGLTEGNEDLTLELVAGEGYRVGPVSGRTAVATIQDVAPTPPGGTTLFAGNGFDDFVKFGATFSEVSDADRGQVIQAEVTSVPPNFFNTQIRQTYSQPVSQDDLIWLDFWVKSIGGEGKLTIKAEIDGPPFTASVEQTITVPESWSRVQIPYASAEDYAAGEASLNFQFGHQLQTLRFDDIQLLTYGSPRTLASSDGLFLNNIGGDFGTVTSVEVTGQDFNTAAQLETVTVPPNDEAWRFQYVGRNGASVSSGNTLRLHFHARRVSTGTATLQMLVQRTDTFATVGTVQSIDLSTEWTPLTLDVTVGEDFDPDGLQAVLNLGFREQTVQVGGLTWQNLNSPYDLGDLPATGSPASYGGRTGDATWRDAAYERIDLHRMTELSVQVVNQSGVLIDGASVFAKQNEHAFRFGTAISALGGWLDANAGAPGQLYRDEVTRLFNTVVLENAAKWPFYEQEPQRAIDAATWAKNEGLYVRGHNIIWPSRRNMPDSVWSQYDALVAAGQATEANDQLRSTIEERITTVATDFAGLVDEWDVVNEPFSENDVMSVLGNDVVIDWFQQFGIESPAIERVLNDYSIFSNNGGNTEHRANFDNWLAQLNAVGAIEYIGEQSHYNEGNLTDMEVLDDLLTDYHAQFGLPVSITEFDVNTTDRQLQADYLRDYLTMSFSQPAVNQFLQWGFWQGAHWLPDAALMDLNFNLKPNGQAYEDLVFVDWWSEASGTTRDGVVTLDVAKGGYLVEVVVGDQTFTATVDASGGPSSVTVTVPDTATTAKLNYSLLNGDTSQRSIVDSLQLKFDQAVTVDASGLQVERVEPDGSATPVGVSAVVDAADPSWISITFFGEETIAGTGGLLDGNHRLVASEGSIRSRATGLPIDGDGDGAPGGVVRFGDNAHDDFFAHFGDADGDRDVDGLDLLKFRRTHRLDSTSTNYNRLFDRDGDGDVDGIDLLNFRRNHRTSLPA